MATPTLDEIRTKTHGAFLDAWLRAILGTGPGYRAKMLHRLRIKLARSPTTPQPSTPEPRELSETCPACHLLSEHAKGCELAAVK
jgi:hypothetical protein